MKDIKEFSHLAWGIHIIELLQNKSISMCRLGIYSLADCEILQNNVQKSITFASHHSTN